MPRESFLEEIAKRPDEEIKLIEQKWEFFMAISVLYDYVSDETGIGYKQRDKPKGEEEILQKLGEGEFRIKTAYTLRREDKEEKYKFEWVENPSARWIYKKTREK